jgi:hypothetical protein
VHIQENRFMLDRLQSIRPVLNVDQLEKDFHEHQKVSLQLRRRRMHPSSGDSPAKDKDTTNDSSLFDYGTYLSQNPSTSSLMADSNSPIKSMAEFRKHVITTKKMNSNLNQSSGSGWDSPARKNGDKSRIENNNEFEMFHSPGK